MSVKSRDLKKQALSQKKLFTQRPPEFRITFEDLFPGEDIFDNFAGGGGISTGTVQATGRPVTAALNHDPEAIAMHMANHPHTKHYCEDITQVDPRDVCRGRRVGLAWFAPDCTHHSKAKGAAPRDNKSRGIARVVIDWANLPMPMKPRLIMVENVEEFEDWGPLLENGRPDKERLGEFFRPWLAALVDAGYSVEFRCMVAADLGAPTTRNRFFLVARRDKLPIVWPEPKFGPGRADPHRTAATSVIDFSIPTISIFGRPERGRFRQLKPATLRRIALGIERFVVNNAEPFIIPVKSWGGGGNGPRSIHLPMRTVTTSKRGEFALVSPFIAPVTHQRDSRVHSIEEPLRTVTGAHRGEFALISPFIVRHGHYSKKTGAGLVEGKGMPGIFRGQSVEKPLGTVTTRDDKDLVMPLLKRLDSADELHASFITKFYGTSTGSDLRDPLPTVTATGQHLGEVRAFLLKYYGAGGRAQGQSLNDPLHTVTTKDRFGLVMVHGHAYQIVDIGMRMLTPRELFRAQDFPDDYIIDVELGGKRLSKEAQVRCAGNAAPPCYARELVAANSRIAA